MGQYSKARIATSPRESSRTRLHAGVGTGALSPLTLELIGLALGHREVSLRYCLASDSASLRKRNGQACPRSGRSGQLLSLAPGSRLFTLRAKQLVGSEGSHRYADCSTQGCTAELNGEPRCDAAVLALEAWHTDYAANFIVRVRVVLRK